MKPPWRLPLSLHTSGGSKTESLSSMLIGEYRLARENASQLWIGWFLLVRVGDATIAGG